MKPQCPSIHKTKVGIISLGCPRNLVDSEILLGILEDNGFQISELVEADIGIINTCAFIDEAKRESIDMILEVIDLKKKGRLSKVIVAGCLAERYGNALMKDMPEVDGFIGCGDIEKIGALIGKLNNKEAVSEISKTHSFIYSHTHPRVKITPPHYMYVKISEGCRNRCSFCVIPDIKGDYRSRPLESVLREVEDASRRAHISEINLVGQDTTLFGTDLTPTRCADTPRRCTINKLLKQLCAFNKYKRWIRLLYTYPSHIDDSLISLFADEKSLCKYIDLPVQHINDRILKAMNRHMSKRDICGIIEKIRKAIPGVTLRSSIIVGFPGETEKEFKELVDFIKDVKFERLGVFTYSREEGTPAYSYKDQISEKIKLERFNTLMSLQRDIAEDINRSFLGKTIDVLIDEKDEDAEDSYIGRTEGDAPEVDGEVFVKGRGLKPGDFAKVKITGTLEYDLMGEALE
ncbi:MAG: 30S ribosomal protein S12 methylthiotransferase RimO [Candidatus Omnitrophica bacterium]|nr:30S ribosomal protein S12 methylthiotransferase RimO [Candidatus Omnitrophota bacterium]MCG2705252.1 30S ribosomal protein S12 methylthiotransferase RimO [Candidatus Omnitrophota bacterium]